MWPAGWFTFCFVHVGFFQIKPLGDVVEISKTLFRSWKEGNGLGFINKLKLEFVECVGQQGSGCCPQQIFDHRKYGGKQGFKHGVVLRWVVSFTS